VSGPMGPTRRAVLGVPLAASALLAAACTGGGTSHGLTPAQTRAVDQARERALAAEQELIAQYDAALLLPEVRADQALVDRLTAVRGEHTAHLAALREGAVGAAAPGSATPDPASPQTPSGAATTAATTAPPMDAKTAVAGLVKAEQAAADRLTADVMATEGHTAQLLASISAAESGHAALLLGGAV
jgi:hypothetical protein